jgi:serine O-acetyltransferase
LLLEDYRAFSITREDPPTRRWLLFVPRMLLNPSLHAVALIRLCNASPAWLFWFWRNLMIWKHSMDVGREVTIGPGLVMVHPFAISIAPGTRIGTRVRVFDKVTLGASPGREGLPEVGDGVVLLPGSVVVGDIRIGDRSVVGANAFVDRDLPPDSVAVSGRAQIMEGAARELYLSGRLQRL